MRPSNARSLVTALMVSFAGAAGADDIKASSDAKIAAPFDIVESRISIDKDHAIFQMRVRADAGADKPRMAENGWFKDHAERGTLVRYMYVINRNPELCIAEV